MASNEIDREEWDKAWSSMPSRCIPSWSRRNLSDILPVIDPTMEVVSATIALNPPTYSHKVPRKTEVCVICGTHTKENERVPVSVYPEFECDGKTWVFGIGGWAHSTCWSKCPPSDDPTPIPW